MNNQQLSNQMVECIKYFQQNAVWKKVFCGFRKKYYSYGKFAGKVTLKNLSIAEKEELEGFFGRSYHGQKSITISSDKFCTVLENSRYKGITPEMILEVYFNEPLLGKKEELQIKEKKRQKIMQCLVQNYNGTPVQGQLEYFYQMLKGNLKDDFEELEGQLKIAAEIYNGLPYRQGQKMYLAVFAAILTGNPHAFDLGTTDGKILYQVVEKDLEVRGLTVDESKLFPAYKRQRSYLSVGILLDDVSNYALLYNVQAMKKDGTMHVGMDGFGKENEMVQVSLGVIAEWKEMRCPQKEIYIVENPSVFAMLCGKSDKEQKNKNCSYMCMNGQPRLSCLIVLDLLAKIGTTVYYAGDLDPEGMLIAQKLSAYYKGKFHFWHMGLEDYRKCRSDEPISAKRLKSMEKITDARLLPIKEEIEKWKVAGYQEKLFSFCLYL